MGRRQKEKAGNCFPAFLFVGSELLSESPVQPGLPELLAG